jgi:hypothetical protein
MEYQGISLSPLLQLHLLLLYLSIPFMSFMYGTKTNSMINIHELFKTKYLVLTACSCYLITGETKNKNKNKNKRAFLLHFLYILKKLTHAREIQEKEEGKREKAVDKNPQI